MATSHFTTVTSVGLATGTYDVATFRITMSTLGKTSAEAQEKLRKNVALGTQLYETLIGKGMNVVEDSLRVDRSTNVERHWNKTTESYEKVGYTATYSASWKTDAMEMVSQIYEAFASLPVKEVHNFAVANPSFKVKDVNALHRAALVDAWEKSKALFQQETTILGIDPASLEIAAYQPHYDASESDVRTEGRSFAMAAGAPMRKTLGGSSDEEAIQLTPGKAKIRVTLTVSYRVKEGK